MTITSNNLSVQQINRIRELNRWIQVFDLERAKGYHFGVIPDAWYADKRAQWVNERDMLVWGDE